VQKAPTQEALSAAVRFIQQESGINLSPPQFLKILSLYPFQRAKLADYGFEDTEVREMMLDVVANVMANTRWPLNGDDVELSKFTYMLRKAAVFMGYSASFDP
jgi:hypothetical protein